MNPLEATQRIRLLTRQESMQKSQELSLWLKTIHAPLPKPFASKIRPEGRVLLPQSDGVKRYSLTGGLKPSKEIRPCWVTFEKKTTIKLSMSTKRTKQSY